MSQKTVLLIDDDEATLLLVRALLEPAGYAVRTARDGAMALVSAKHNVPDLIVVDIGLPGGDGLSVLRRLRAMGALNVTPVIVLTGKEDPDWRRRSEEAGASHFMTKPVDKDELLAQVRARLPDEGPERTARCPQCGHEFQIARSETESG
jgi:two-component system KDP operon response regulator KdpE